MIVTVTVNAALDRTLTVPVFQIGYRHRSSEALTLAGGKGINVARALKRLEVPVVATGLAGGRTGTVGLAGRGGRGGCGSIITRAVMESRRPCRMLMGRWSNRALCAPIRPDATGARGILARASNGMRD